MSPFRKRVLAVLDDWYKDTGGTTPDHIIVSERNYRNLSPEILYEETPLSGEGYIGMTLWCSAVLDDTVDAIVLSQEMFERFVLDKLDSPKDL